MTGAGKSGYGAVHERPLHLENEPMLFDPHAPAINRNTGEPMMEENKRVVTFGLLVVRALDAKFPDEKDLKPEDGFKRFLLATRIVNARLGEAVDLTIEEAKSIKDTVAKAYPPGVFGQIWQALDEAAKAKAGR